MLEGRYILTADNHIRFDVSGYDKAKPLVIDPVLVYSTYFGIGEDHMGSSAIAVDSSGYAYIAGWGPVPVTTGAFQTTTNNYEPAFVTKFDPTGSTLVYSTYLGGSQPTNQSFGIAVDSTGNAYVTGDTDSSDFPTTPGSFQANPLNGQCSATTCNTKIFVTKLSATGNGLVYATYLDGNADDHSRGIALDAADNVYLTGYTDSTSFPTTSGAFQTAYGGGSPGYNAFVTKLNAAGTGLVFSTYLGGSSFDYGYGIAVDSSGNAYVAGGPCPSISPRPPERSKRPVPERSTRLSVGAVKPSWRSSVRPDL